MEESKVMMAVSDLGLQVEDDFHMLESVDINVMLRSFLDPGPWAQTLSLERAGSPSCTCPAEATFCRPDGNFMYCRPIVLCTHHLSQRHIHHGAGRTSPPEYDQTGSQALQVKAHEQGRNQGQEQGYAQRHSVLNFQSLTTCR